MIKNNKRNEALSHITTSNHVVELQHIKQCQGPRQADTGVTSYYFRSSNALPSKINNNRDGKCTSYVSSIQPPVEKKKKSQAKNPKIKVKKTYSLYDGKTYAQMAQDMREHQEICLKQHSTDLRMYCQWCGYKRNKPALKKTNQKIHPQDGHQGLVG